jgi:4-hydroxybenzoate polyprenyltransferase
MKRFFALSRTSHGILELGAPGFVAILWLGEFPEWQTILLSLFTAFAAYTAIYALNDLVGIDDDREKFVDGEIKEGYSVEASALRYPLARGAVSVREAWLWFTAWFVIALIGAYFLNPVIVLILLGAAVLEVVYCRLLKVTYLRAIASGFVKSSGPIAAIFVVDPNPNPQSVLLLLAWFFFWEIGGQNIPADWNDTEEDERVGAKTIPLLFGFQSAGRVVITMLGLTVVLSLLLPTISPLPLGWPYLIATALAGYFLLLRPAYELYRCLEGRCAAELFDHASYYPLAHLAIISVFAVFSL